MEAKRGAETHPAFYSDEPTLGYYSHGAEENMTHFILLRDTQKNVFTAVFPSFLRTPCLSQGGRV